MFDVSASTEVGESPVTDGNRLRALLEQPVADELTVGFVEFNERDVVREPVLERLVIGVVIDHPRNHAALAGRRRPVPLGGKTLGTLRARRKP